MSFSHRRLSLALAPLLFGGGLLGPARPGQAEILVRNASFSTLAIAVVDPQGREVGIGQAPPEFANTLYLPADDSPVELRLRARLRGSDDILYESGPVTVCDGTRLRWRLPENVIEVVRARATAPAGRAGSCDTR